MGVDFYVCKRCDDTFPDCGYYISCGCGKKWCSEQCAEEDGYVCEDDYEYEGDWYEGDRNCSYCRLETADDHTLFLFLRTKLNLTREEVLDQWKASVKAK